MQNFNPAKLKSLTVYRFCNIVQKTFPVKTSNEVQVINEIRFCILLIAIKLIIQWCKCVSLEIHLVLILQTEEEKMLTDRMKNLHTILGGEVTIGLHLQFLIRNNKTDTLILKNTKVDIIKHSGISQVKRQNKLEIEERSTK